MPKSRVYLSLGGNIGDKRAYLQEAVRLLDKIEKSQVLEISSLYETAAWGLEDQDDFYNIVVLLETELEPLELLDKTQEIENGLDRERKIYWGPRTIDIDLLLFDDKKINHERLEIPHPRMTKRRFVMEPLSELAPDLLVEGRKAEKYLEELVDEGLEKVGELF